MRALVIDADWDPRPTAALSEEEIRRRRALDGTQVWRRPRWSVGERPDPRIERDDDVIVRSRAVGICGSDVHMYETDEDGYVLLPYQMAFPVAGGHEVAGEVVEVGPGVRGLRPGDPVAVETHRYCDRCEPCRRGLFNQCSASEDNGFTLDGGMAEHLLTRERHARSLRRVRERFGEQDTYEIGALSEPLSVAFVGMFLKAGGFLPGAAVAVFGCGPIGLACIALARCAGAAVVMAFDREPARCAVARRLGADHVFEVDALARSGTRPAEAILDLTRGAGADMAIEASGAAGAVLPELEASLGVAGRAVLLGVEARPVPTSTVSYQIRAASLTGTVGHLGGFDAAIALHASGRLDARPMITARYELSRGLEAMAKATERTDAKIMIVPDGTLA